MANTSDELKLIMTGDSASAQAAAEKLTEKLDHVWGSLANIGKQAATAQAQVDAIKGPTFDSSSHEQAIGFFSGLTAVIREPTEALAGFVEEIGTSLPLAVQAGMGVLLAAGSTLLLLGKIAYEAAQEVWALTEAAGRVGQAIEELSMTTGLSVGRISELRFAANALGKEMGVLASASFMMSRRIASGTKDVDAALTKLGLTADEFGKLPMDEQMLTISDRLREVKGGTDRVTIAFGLMGRQGRSMLPVLLQPLRDLTEQGKELGFTWGETDVQAAHDFEVVTNTLHLVMEKFWIDIGKEMLPRMVELVHAVTTSTALLDGLKLVAGVVAFAIKGVFDEMRLKETILYLEAAYRLALATGMIPDLTAYEDEVAVRIAIAEKLLKNRGAALQPPEQSDNADTYLATVNRQMGVAALAADEYTESLRKLNPEADKEARRLFETGASLKVVTDQLQKYNIVTDEEISLLAGVEGQVRKAMKAREEAAQEALSQFRKGVAAQKKDEADHLKERAAAEKAVDAQSLRAVKVAMDAENVKHKAAIQHYAELFVAAGEAADALAAMGLSGTDLDVYNLKRARAAEVAKLGDQPGRAGASQDVYDKAKTAIDARYDREVERAKGAYRTIEESMRAHGDSTSAEREKDYQDAKKYYDDLVESDSASEDQISAAREKMWAADAARRGESLSGWRATNAELARSFQQLAQIATGTMSDVASAIGTVFGALDTLGSAMTTLQTSLTKIKTKGSKGAGFMELAESIMAAVGAAVALHSALNSLFGIKSDSKAGNAATGAASGAMAGAMIGSAVPGIGTAIGAGIGALIGLFGGLSSAMKAANKAKEDFAALGKEIDKTYGSIANAATAAGLLGVALTSTTDRSVAGVKKLTAEMKVLAEKMAELQAALDKYGFTWEDMGEAWQKLHFEKFADQLLDDFHLLINSGIESNKVIAGMADALSELVGASVRTGQKIPAALQPILAKLIEMGKLSTEAQQALLGLGDGVAYAWDDVQAAMERYGLTAAMLGGPMMQKQIDAQAKTITADWKILTGSGADVNTVALGMANQVQAIIDAAMSSGLSIDAGLKPIIQALAGMGQLRGKNGAAFDESLLSYQQTSDDIMTGVANENTDRLLAKLNELISAVGGTPKSIRSRTPNVDGLGGGSSTGRTSEGTGAIPGGRSGLTTNVNLNLDGRELTRATITQEYAYANLYGNR